MACSPTGEAKRGLERGGHAALPTFQLPVAGSSPQSSAFSCPFPRLHTHQQTPAALLGGCRGVKRRSPASSAASGRAAEEPVRIRSPLALACARHLPWAYARRGRRDGSSLSTAAVTCLSRHAPRPPASPSPGEAQTVHFVKREALGHQRGLLPLISARARAQLPFEPVPGCCPSPQSFPATAPGFCRPQRRCLCPSLPQLQLPRSSRQHRAHLTTAHRSLSTI